MCGGGGGITFTIPRGMQDEEAELREEIDSAKLDKNTALDSMKDAEQKVLMSYFRLLHCFCSPSLTTYLPANVVRSTAKGYGTVRGQK